MNKRKARSSRRDQARIGESNSALGKEPWYKRTWVIVSTTACALGFILVNGPQMLSNARIIPDQVRETVASFKSWLYEDSEWTGSWSASPEAYADISDMQLSDVDMQLTIWASQGDIDGTIATSAICNAVPFNSYLLLRGEVSGDTAQVIVWDVIGGRKIDFATLRLARDGSVLTVEPTGGMNHLFPGSARIAKSSPEPTADPEPNFDFCTGKRRAEPAPPREGASATVPEA